jgi:uncharacterized protein YbjT (DUF2867 family)
MKASLPRAILFGSTGLVGSFLLEELSRSPVYGDLIVVNRRPTLSQGTKGQEIIRSMDQPGKLDIPFAPGDHVFICLGTTIRKAGSVAAMDQIDRQLPVAIAKAAHSAGATRLGVVSSIGASAASNNYYLRIKGMMEAEIAELHFDHTLILRPSILLGPRKEFRFGETLGKFFMQAFRPLLIGRMRRYRGIQAAVVAKVMLSALGSGSGLVVVESGIIEMMADRV